jgi:hypothetical protein
MHQDIEFCRYTWYLNVLESMVCNLDEIFYMMLNIIEVILNMLDHQNVVNMLMLRELINGNHEFYVNNYMHDQVQVFV